MSLDLTKVAAQIGAMISGLKDSRAERDKRLQFALKTIGNPAVDLEALKKKCAAAKTTWLVAELLSYSHHP